MYVSGQSISPCMPFMTSSRKCTDLTASVTLPHRITNMYCKKSFCPTEVLSPSEDCTLNVSSPFTLQICRVEDVDIFGVISGTVVHIQRARNVTVNREGVLSASGLGVSLTHKACFTYFFLTTVFFSRGVTSSLKTPISCAK